MGNSPTNNLSPFALVPPLVDEAWRDGQPGSVDGLPGAAVDRPDLGNGIAADGDIGHKGRAAVAVVDGTVADEDVVHGRQLSVVSGRLVLRRTPVDAVLASHVAAVHQIACLLYTSPSPRD